MLRAADFRSAAAPPGRAVRATAAGDSGRARLVRLAAVLLAALGADLLAALGADLGAAASLVVRVSRAGRRAVALLRTPESEVAATDEVGESGWESSALATPQGSVRDRPSATAVAPNWAAPLNVDTTAPPFAIPPRSANLESIGAATQ